MGVPDHQRQRSFRTEFDGAGDRNFRGTGAEFPLDGLPFPVVVDGQAQFIIARFSEFEQTAAGDVLLRKVHEIKRRLPDGFPGAAEMEFGRKVFFIRGDAVVEVDAAHLKAGHQLHSGAAGGERRLFLCL